MGSDATEILLTEEPWSLIVSDGSSLYRVGPDGSLLWRNETPAWICPIDRTRDGSLVVVGTCTNAGGHLILYDSDGRELWRELVGGITSGAAITSDGQFIMGSSYQYALRKFDQRGRLILDWEERYPDSDFPCDPYLVKLLDDQGDHATAGGGCIAEFDPSGRIAWQVQDIGDAYDLEVSDDGGLLVVGSNDGLLRAYDRSGQEVWHLEMDDRWTFYSVAISGDSIIALAGRPTSTGKAHVLRRTGEVLWSSDDEESVAHAAISGDGQVIATADYDSRVGITLRSVNGAVLGKIYPSTPEVTTIALSHDGRSIFVGGSDRDLMHFRR